MLAGWSKTDEGICEVKALGTETDGNKVICHRSRSVAVDEDSKESRCKDGNFKGGNGANGKK